jgi:hypothetical protein
MTPMTIQITKPEVEALVNQRLQSGDFKHAEDVIFQALCASRGVSPQPEQDRTATIDLLATFGKKHGLSLGGITIRDLRHEARP